MRAFSNDDAGGLTQEQKLRVLAYQTDRRLTEERRNLVASRAQERRAQLLRRALAVFLVATALALISLNYGVEGAAAAGYGLSGSLAFFALLLAIDHRGQLRGWIRCTARGRCEPLRHPLGGFRCSSCGKAGEDLDDFGFFGTGYVSPMRRKFDRTNRTVTRESW